MNNIKTRNLQISIEIREMDTEILGSRLECRFKTNKSKDEFICNIVFNQKEGMTFQKFYKNEYGYSVMKAYDTDDICESIFNQIGIYTKIIWDQEQKQVMNDAKKMFKTATETAIINATEETAELGNHKECFDLSVISRRAPEINELNKFLKNDKKKERDDGRGEGM